MEARELVFAQAKTVQHEIHGECRMEVWRVHQSAGNTVREPEYVVQFYKHGQLIDSSY